MRSFKVQSRTQEGVEYIVKIEYNGEIICNCNAGKRGVACNHLSLIRKFINREYISSVEYDRLKEIK